MSLNDSFALITGATSGLGLQMAHLCAEKKHNLLLVSRNEEKLKSLSCSFQNDYGIEVQVLAVDLTENDSAQKVFDWVQNIGVTAEIVINNAGMGTFGNFNEIDLLQEQDMIDLNIRSLVSLTHLFVSDMKKQDSGKILNVGSIAGFQPVPLLSGYAATKAYVNSFSQSLAYELRNTNVSVSVLCPGPFESKFGDVAKMGNSKNFDGTMLSAQKIAQIGYEGMMKGKVVILPSLWDSFQVFVQRFVPRSLVTSVAAAKVTYKN